MNRQQLIEAVLAELREVAGGVMTVEFLSLMPVLGRMAKVREGKSSEQGDQIVEFLLEEILLIEGPILFRGQELNVARCKEAWIMALDLNEYRVPGSHKPLCAYKRRLLVVQILACGGMRKYKSWRRPEYEGEFLRILGESIVEHL